MFLIFLCACGGDPALDRARAHYSNQRLEAAEALLADRDDEPARKLRERIQEAQSVRAARLFEVDQILETLPPDEARTLLRQITRGDSDPMVRELAGAELSILANRLAEESVSGLTYSQFKNRAPLDVASPDRGSSAPRSTESLVTLRPDRMPESLREQPRRPDTEREVERGPVSYVRNVPDSGARAPARKPEADAPTVQVASATPALAAELERAGRLDDARAVWLELTLTEPPGPGRSSFVARARSLERRAVLQAELLAAIGADPGRFAPDGVEGANEHGLVMAGADVAWAELDAPLLRRLASRAETLSREAQLGLVLERLARSDAADEKGADAKGALAELERLVRRGEVEEAEAFAIVADHRGEPLPEGGYAFHAGEWLTRADYDAAVLRARIESLASRLARAKGADRDAAAAEFVEIGYVARHAFTTALEERLADASKSLARGATLAALEKLAERRRELDERRVAALALIFDEDTYFYPYTGDGIPQGKRASDYWPVQRRVDELVAGVQEVWSEAGDVRLADSFLEALAEIDWVLTLAGEHTLGLALPEALPSWIAGLPALATVNLRTFAWDAEEKKRLEYDRAVLARNERVWGEWARRDGERKPRVEEREQVSVTNEYRRMMGRRALAWNADVQMAARGHSEYMADTGDFGHFETDPERRTPFDRMRLAGYHHGVSENCHMGSGSAEGAHQGWRRSSGHHRNLLMAGHREMASALASIYWTQNFGTGTQFLGELDGWQD